MVFPILIRTGERCSCDKLLNGIIVLMNCEKEEEEEEDFDLQAPEEGREEGRSTPRRTPARVATIIVATRGGGTMRREKK